MSNSGNELGTRVFREKVVERTTRAGTTNEIHRALCPNCGKNIDRVMNMEAMEWKAQPSNCVNCGADAPWERGWDAEIVEGSL